MWKSNGGFTLLELMIVVAIISVSAVLAGPAVHSAWAERAGGRAALEVVRLINRARAEAVGYGRAHLVRFEEGTGTWTLYRGVSNSCGANPWTATLIPAGACGVATSHCVDSVSIQETAFILGATTFSVVETGGGALLDMCFEPSGAMQHRTGALGTFSGLNTVNGGFRFTITRQDSGTTVGATRNVVVPLGGSARLL